ncbi:hypothetical protein BDV12DRAFT_208024 [Aspergillus spectabilis]
MPKGRGRQKIDRKAVAAANSYIRGANRELDQKCCEIIYSDDSITLQERVILIYVSWASEENQDLRDKGLQKGHPVPDLAMIKDFVRFYISSTDRILSLRPTKSSVLNFAEQFFAGFTRITKSIFDKKDTQDVFTFIKKRLVKEEKVIKDIRRAKHMFTHCNLTNILVLLWNNDDPVFIHPRYRDIELYIYRRPDSKIELFFRLSKIWVKNNNNPKNTMAFQDGAFLHINLLDDLKSWNPNLNNLIPLLWKPSVAKEPVLRIVTRAGGVSKCLWTRESFCKIFRAVVTNAGYPEIITIHTLRRGLANMLDNLNIFGRSYIDSTSAVSTMDAFLGEKMRLDYIKYLRGVGKYRALGYPRYLPAERQHAIRQNETLQELEQRLQELQETPHTSIDADNGHGERDNNAADSGKEDVEFAIKLTKKQLQVLRSRLYNTKLAKYRDEWIQNRLETQVKSGGKTLNVVVYNDITQCLSKAQPEQQRIAELMPTDKSFSYQDMLSAVEDLLVYCIKNYDVFYRLREEPLNGRCPVRGCDLDLDQRCEIITYCHILVQPGYYPFCLGCDRVAPSQRMNVWKQSNELRLHVNEDIKQMRENYFCSHLLCHVKFDSEIQLRYHLSDIHGMHKAIWGQVGGPVKPSKKKDLNYQVNSPVGAAKRKGQALVGRGEEKGQHDSGPPNDPAVAYELPSSTYKRLSSLSANANELVIKLWERPVKTATKKSLVGLSATAPTLSCTNDKNSIADKEHNSDYNGCSPCISILPSPPDLATGIGFESSTTSTSPKLPPIDPQILLESEDQPVELGKERSEVRKINKGGALSSENQKSFIAETLWFDKLWLAKERDLSTDTPTELVEINSILETMSTAETQERNSQTLARKRAAQSQDNHTASHKSSRVTRSSYARQNACFSEI